VKEFFHHRDMTEGNKNKLTKNLEIRIFFLRPKSGKLSDIGCLALQIPLAFFFLMGITVLLTLTTYNSTKFSPRL